MRTIKIGGKVFGVTEVAPMKSFALTPLFAPALGKAIRQIALTAQAAGVLSDKDVTELTLADVESFISGSAGKQKLTELLLRFGPDLVSALGETIGTMRPDALQVLTRELLASALVDGAPLFPSSDDERFNETFKGKPFAIWRLVLFALQVNYADFSLAPVGGEKTSGAAVPASPSPASTT